MERLNLELMSKFYEQVLGPGMREVEHLSRTWVTHRTHYDSTMVVVTDIVDGNHPVPYDFKLPRIFTAHRALHSGMFTDPTVIAALAESLPATQIWLVMDTVEHKAIGPIKYSLKIRRIL